MRTAQCAAADELVAVGEIISVNGSHIEVLSAQGEIFKLEISGCTNINSNHNRDPRVGDQAACKGNKISARDIEALELLCLA